MTSRVEGVRTQRDGATLAFQGLGWEVTSVWSEGQQCSPPSGDPCLRGLGWEAQLPTPGANPRPASATAASPFQLTQAKQPLNPLRTAAAVPRARAARGWLGAGPGAWGGARVSNLPQLAGAGARSRGGDIRPSPPRLAGGRGVGPEARLGHVFRF